MQNNSIRICLGKIQYRFMAKTFHFLLFNIIILPTVLSQENDTTAINDGPYVFIENNQLIEQSIVNGQVQTKILKSNTYDTLYYPESSTFKNVKKIAVFSDIHGQYDLAIKILKNNKIIDKNGKWNYGRGHLVIVGDIFDRGPKVNEMLWFVKNLEQQAKKKGGQVHYLLGNHEYMVLHNDIRYVNEKYLKSSELLNRSYPELYGMQTVMGRWLRSKPTIIRINNQVFVHGGISQQFIDKNEMQLDTINNIMRQSIDRTKEEMSMNDFYETYYGNTGPIWYRGYFYDNLSDADVSKILSEIDTEHIVVGHCSNEEIVELYNQKIFGVDSSIKKGEYGELLFIKRKKYSRGTMKGKKERFKKHRIEN